MIMFGFLLQWPTIITVAMFPILVWMYMKLAGTEEHDDGHVHYFCSQESRKKFEAAPLTYAYPANGSTNPHECHHACRDWSP
jgi:hypothetical protein